MILEIPMLAPGLNGDNGMIRMHFGKYTKVKKEWAERLKQQWLLVPPAKRKLTMPVSIQMCRYYCSQPMDIDNLYSTCKIPLDAMRKAGILPDDDPSCVSSLIMSQTKVPKRDMQKTVILITNE